jgi:hypothetical protein
MSKHRTPLRELEPVQEPQPPQAPQPSRWRKPTTIQQPVYLPPAVHDQLRELAFAERVRMHALLMEGLDLVFKARGPKPLSPILNLPLPG